ncbi:unnamed protein product [Hyaloperonospora brassicae]|nr:unnamed protein product [Hyaloperonospora brassicae]
MGCSLALGRHISYNLFQRTFHPDLAQLLQESMGGSSRHKSERRLTINHVEEQTLSMSLDDVHTTSYLSDFGHTDADIVKRQHRSRSSARTSHEQQPTKDPPSTTGTSGMPVKSGATEYYTANVYSEPTSEETTWDRAPSTMLRPTPRRRTTGYAFSCDEETTLAESYIASNSLPRSDAISIAMRNSTGDANGRRYSRARVPS